MMLRLGRFGSTSSTLGRLAADGIPKPCAVGDELSHVRARSWVEAELVWSDRQVALERAVQLEMARGAAPDGWTIVDSAGGEAFERVVSALSRLTRAPSS
jgi:hypothetical protein